jgi:hypothetical protein
VNGARLARVHARLHEADRPRVALHRRPRRGAAPTQLRFPVTFDGRRIHLAEHDVDHPVEKILLVRYVPVERHGGCTELVCEVAHRERVEPAGIGQGDCGLHDLPPAQAEPGTSRFCSLRHLCPF